VRRIDPTNGPCLGIVAPDRVADIAHHTRQAVDEDPPTTAPPIAAARRTTSSSSILMAA